MTVKLDSLDDWNAVELKAQTAELASVTTNKVPLPTQAQQLLWATQRCAELQASVHRKNGAMSEAIMWLSVNQPQRALEVLNRGLLDL